MLSLGSISPVRRLGSTLTPKVAKAEAAIKPHVNRAVLGMGVAYPVATLPQLYNVWVLGRTGGLSEITYGAGLVMASAWTLYGVINRDRAIWIVNMLWIAIHTAMFIGLARGGA